MSFENSKQLQAKKFEEYAAESMATFCGMVEKRLGDKDWLVGNKVGILMQQASPRMSLHGPYKQQSERNACVLSILFHSIICQLAM